MNKITALVWEQWRHSRFVILLAPLFIFFIYVMMKAISSTNPGDMPDAALWTGLCATAFFVALAISFSDPQDLSFGFDRRLYRLPLRSTRLAAVTLLARLALMAIGMSMVLGMCYWLFGRGDGFLLWPTLAFVFIVFSGAHALSWSIGAYGAKAALFFIGALFVWMVAGIFFPSVRDFSGLYLVIELVKWSHRVGGRVGLWLLSLATIAFFFAIAVAGVWLDRRGMWQSSGPKAERLSILSRLFSRQRTFASPYAAQFAFEWQRRGRLFLRMTMFVFVFLAMLMAFAFNFKNFHVQPESINWGGIILALMYAAIVAPPCAAFMLGVLNVRLDKGDRKSGLAAFLAVRPMSSRAFGVARIEVAAWIVLTSIAFVALPILLLLTIDALWYTETIHRVAQNFVQGLHRSGSQSVMTTVAVYILGTWALVWIWSRTTAIIALSSIAYIGVWLLLAVAGADLSDGIANVFGCMFFSLIVLMATAYTFWKSRRHRLIGKMPTLISLTLWATAVSVSLYQMDLPKNGDSIFIVLLTASLLALPFLPIATVPLAIHRHRSGGTGSIALNS